MSRRNLKCILLSERSQQQKGTYCMISTICHSGTGKTMETVKRSVVPRDCREGRLLEYIFFFQNTFLNKRIQVIHHFNVHFFLWFFFFFLLMTDYLLFIFILDYINDVSIEDFQGREGILYDTIIVDIYHYVFVRIHRMYSIKSEP